MEMVIHYFVSSVSALGFGTFPVLHWS